VKKLLLILECYFEPFERALEDSRRSQIEILASLGHNNVVKPEVYSDLVDLLYHFLMRHAPLIGKFKIEMNIGTLF
jgi:hypothetical protein